MIHVKKEYNLEGHLTHVKVKRETSNVYFNCLNLAKRKNTKTNFTDNQGKNWLHVQFSDLGKFLSSQAPLNKSD